MKSVAIVTAALLALADAMPDLRSGRDPARLAARQATKGKGEQQDKENPAPNIWTHQGCYSSSGDLKKMTNLDFNAIDSCSKICIEEGFEVAGTQAGFECWCGHTYPPKEDYEEDGKNCNYPCSGFGDHACGGIEYWSIYNTGIEIIVKHYGEKDDKDDKSSTTTTSTPTPTQTNDNQLDRPSETAEPSEGGTNVGGIVAGVVVAVVVIASAIGGGFLWWRRKRNQEIEEEHRRNAAVNAFIGKPPSSSGGVSITDSRLDPVMAQRRMSDGSIADNQDYSRRILRVTNA